MTEAPKTGPDAGEPGQNPQEHPVTRDYIRALVKDYISFGTNSERLRTLVTAGLPDYARTKSSLELKDQNLQQDLRDVLLTVLETYGFWGEILRKPDQSEMRHAPYKNFVYNQGLPHLKLIRLDHSLANVENPTVRFGKNKAGTIIVKGVDFKDFTARGIPVNFSMSAQYYVVELDGEVKFFQRSWPGKEENGKKRPYEDRRLLSAYSPLSILKQLVTIALNGAKMQENGEFFSFTENPKNGEKKIKNRPKIFT